MWKQSTAFRLQHRYFHVNISDFVKTAFFTERLWWLLLKLHLSNHSLLIPEIWNSFNPFDTCFILLENTRNSLVFWSLRILQIFLSIQVIFKYGLSPKCLEQIFTYLKPKMKLPVSILYLLSNKEPLFIMVLR